MSNFTHGQIPPYKWISHQGHGHFLLRSTLALWLKAWLRFIVLVTRYYMLYGCAPYTMYLCIAKCETENGIFFCFNRSYSTTCMYPNMQKWRQITCVSDHKFWVLLQTESSNVFQITTHYRDKSWDRVMPKNKVNLWN